MTEQSSGPPSRGRRRAPRRAPDVVEEQTAQEAPPSNPDDFGAGVDDPVKPWDNHSDDQSDDLESDVGDGSNGETAAPPGVERPHYSAGGGDYDSGPRRRRRRRRRRRPNEGGYNEQSAGPPHRGGGQRGGHYPHHQNRSGGGRPRGGRPMPQNQMRSGPGPAVRTNGQEVSGT